ncbi:hypothetical protein BC829DRAFT_247939 [Chytridium lagenaria]|nr:hypothetical protein BC829DRAFT_247939 [Chytridium lagenaria]
MIRPYILYFPLLLPQLFILFLLPTPPNPFVKETNSLFFYNYFFPFLFFAKKLSFTVYIIYSFDIPPNMKKKTTKQQKKKHHRYLILPPSRILFILILYSTFILFLYLAVILKKNMTICSQPPIVFPRLCPLHRYLLYVYSLLRLTFLYLCWKNGVNLLSCVIVCLL